MPSKKYYAYYIDEGKEQGILESWDECKEVIKGKKSKYKSFKDYDNAKEWLEMGADYEYKPFSSKLKLEEGVYFDAGTGRGKGVETRVTDKMGESLLWEFLDDKDINEYGNYKCPEGSTNNFGELAGIYFALKVAKKRKIKKIFGDSKLVIDFWSKGIYNEKNLNKLTIKLLKNVIQLRKEFENEKGNISYISGDENPADLGFHK